jgi:hypothetical protein
MKHMSGLTIEKLPNGTSTVTRLFLADLAVRRPDWINYLSWKDDEGEPYASLSLPSLDSDRQLDIETFGQEVTVSFADTHFHREWPHDPAWHELDVIQEVEQILSDELVCISVRESERLKWSSLGPDDQNIEDMLPKDTTLQVRVISWSGKRDRQFVFRSQSS